VGGRGRRQRVHRLKRRGYLTQYGRSYQRKGDDFDSRPEDEQQGLSLIRGKVSIEQASQLVRERGLQPGDAVRHTTVGCLKDAGFEVRHSPLRGFRDHCSVKWPNLWDDEVERRFEECWNEPIRTRTLPP
jgi:hypothetical protein